MSDFQVQFGSNQTTRTNVNNAQIQLANLGELKDVDTTGVDNGDVLMYNETTEKWEAKPIEIIDGGTF